MEKKKENCKVNRKRDVQKIIRMTNEEELMIKKKMELSGYEEFNNYILQMAIDGFIIIPDYEPFIKASKMMHDIGIDINKIAHRAEIIELQEERIKRGEKVELLEPPISIYDIQRIDKHMENIYRTLNDMFQELNGANARDKIRKGLKRKITEDKKNYK